MIQRAGSLAAALTVILLIGADARSQTLTGTVQHEQWGISFTIPDGWMGELGENGYAIGSQTQAGFILILPHESRTIDALRAEAQAGIADGAGTMLKLQGEIEAFGDHGLAADFAGFLEGHQARAFAIGLISPHGTGATILAAAAPKDYTDELEKAAESVARSIDFSGQAEASTARAAAVEPAGNEEQEWHEFLRGCRLYVNDSYNSGDGSGIIDETTIDLCPGYFTFTDHNLTVFNETDPVSGSDPYLHSNRKGAGQWEVVRKEGASVLQLSFHGGAVKSMTLGYEDGKTFLDGRRWLRSCNPNLSVGPQCR